MNEVEAFYDRGAQYEWERLEHHRTEFAVTLRALKDYLPPVPAKILDVGGGPGRYAIALAQLGYEVTLFDLSQSCLELAKQKAQEAGVKVAGFEHGDARDLSRFSDESFDSVLLMGPLYHLLIEEERRQAIREARRVLKPKGIIFAAFITRGAVIRWAAKEEPDWIIKHPQHLETLLSSGALRKRSDDPGFTSAYFAHPNEIKPLIESEGFETLDLIACEGVVSMIEEKINELTGETFDAWVELNYKLGKDPSVHGATEHLLYVGRKRSK
ncbi:MAG: class I SAM-dependent methyltransferase [Candidatus Bipolaricaulota bacterium]|nr:class I SAM-dependent methyltransferase [Candidatus Bipolaricaulota bacterium]